MYSRGIRDVPVEVISTAHQLRSRKKGTRRPSAENDNMLQGEAAPHPMDVDETSWAEEPVMPTSEKRVRQPACPFLANLTYLPVPAHLHSRLYPQDCTLPRLSPQVRRRSSNDYMPELPVCSIRVEVLRLLSCTRTLQGVLPKVTRAPSFSQGSKMGLKLLQAIMVAGGWSALATWAFWRPMPKSNCVL